MMHKKYNFQKSIRYTILGLPLVGIIVSSMLPISTFGSQLLMLILLVWFQVFFIFDIFFNGK